MILTTNSLYESTRYFCHIIINLVYLYFSTYIYTHIYTQIPLALLYGKNSKNCTMISQAKCYYVFLANECTCTSCIDLGYVGMSGCRPIRSKHP